MALQFSSTVRNAAGDALESAVGVSAILKFRTGAPPATCATADSGTVIATLNLPSDWMAAAAAGVKSKTGTWEDTAADATGHISHYRIYASDGVTCHHQGLAVGPWKPSTTYALGDYVTNDTGKVYKCVTAGASAGSGGPTGTSAGIVDNAAHWDYIQAAADMSIDNADVVAGQDIQVTQYDITIGGA